MIKLIKSLFLLDTKENSIAKKIKIKEVANK